MKRSALLLLVPLAWVSFGFADPVPQASPAAKGWRQTQKTDDVRGFAYNRFTLIGKFLNSPRNAGSDRPAFALDCIASKDSATAKGKFLAANLLVGTTLKIVYVEPEEIHGTSYYPKVAVQYRVDQAKEEREQWSTAAEKSSVSIPKDSLKKILRARTVAITADDDRGSQVSMQFDMPDPTLVEDACDVDYHK
jgi:hypothetical protein